MGQEQSCYNTGEDNNFCVSTFGDDFHCDYEECKHLPAGPHCNDISISKKKIRQYDDFDRVQVHQAEASFALLRAAQAGDLKAVTNSIQDGAFLETRRPFGLCTGIVKRKRETPGQIGLTPLMCAAQGGYLSCVQQLLESKASVNAVEEEGMTPLHLACACNEPIVAKELLAAGADKDAYDDNGMLPLDLVPDLKKSLKSEQKKWEDIFSCTTCQIPPTTTCEIPPTDEHPSCREEPQTPQIPERKGMQQNFTLVGRAQPYPKAHPGPGKFRCPIPPPRTSDASPSIAAPYSTCQDV